MNISEFKTIGLNPERFFYCETIEQAYGKLNFRYPDLFDFIGLEKTKTFKSFDDFVKNKKS